jgi:hypothetical protein
MQECFCSLRFYTCFYVSLSVISEIDKKPPIVFFKLLLLASLLILIILPDVKNNWLMQAGRIKAYICVVI